MTLSQKVGFTGAVLVRPLPMSKASMHKVTPRDILAIADTSASFFSLVGERKEYLSLAEDFSSSFEAVIDFSSDAIRAINRDCTNAANAGTVILSGYDAALDESRSYLDNGESLLSQYMERIKKSEALLHAEIVEHSQTKAHVTRSKPSRSRTPA